MERFCIFIFAICIYSISSQITQRPCRSAQIFGGNKCFFIENQPAVFVMCDQHCGTIGYRLASMHSMFENSFLQNEAAISLDPTFDSFYIGLHYSHDQWQWLDGSSFDFYNWAPGEPNTTNTCVAMRVSDGKWVSNTCGDFLPYSCSGILANMSTPRPPATTTAYHTCPPNFAFYPPTFSCYNLILITTDWNGVLGNMTTSSIISADEDSFVKDFASGVFANLSYCFKGSTEDQMYIIGWVNYQNATLHWIDGEPMNYTPTDGCQRFNVPNDGNAHAILAAVDYQTQKICWYLEEQTVFGDEPSRCKYYVKKISAH